MKTRYLIIAHAVSPEIPILAGWRRT